MRVSKLTLGTAQLGSKYGIANRIGKPSYEAAMDILDTAVKNNINCFDTAYGYSDSENILGSFLNSDKQYLSMQYIISKLPKIDLAENTPYEEIYLLVKKYVLDSLQRLKIKKIPIYLLHSEFNINSHNGKVVTSLVQLKNEGLLGKIGASVYSPDHAKNTLGLNEIEVLQFPINIFDQRFLANGFLSEIAKKKIIFARSIFLQGLFFLKPQELPKKLSHASKYLEKLRIFAKHEAVSINQLALAFVNDLPEVTSIVVGAESTEQILVNSRLIDSFTIDNQLRNKIMDTFSNIPLEIILPTHWNLG